LTNLSPLEINELRPFFVRAMGVMGTLEVAEEEGGARAEGRDEDDEDEDD